jgi:hypothetical protein
MLFQELKRKFLPFQSYTSVVGAMQKLANRLLQIERTRQEELNKLYAKQMNAEMERDNAKVAYDNLIKIFPGL